MNILQFFLINEYYFIFSIFVLFLFCVYIVVASKYNLLSIYKQLVCSSIIFLLFYLILLFIDSSGTQYILFNLIILDDFTIYIQSILIIVSILFILISPTFIVIGKIYSSELYLLLLVAILGFLLLISFVDIIGIYLSIELVSMCFYLLTTFSKQNIYSNEAALKYFILGSISSNFILFGFSFIYISTGMTNLIDVSKLIARYLANFIEIFYIFENNIIIMNLIFAFFFIFIGLFFKIYAAPFHLWIPDIYQSAPVLITAFFNTIPLLSFITIILRCSFYFNVLNPVWNYFFLFFACCSIFFGAICALFQSKIRRLLAYSAVTHIGYFLIFIYLFLYLSQLNIYIIQLFYTYIILYLFTNIGIFSILFNLYVLVRHGAMYVDELFCLNKLYKSNGLLSFMFIIFFFSIAGLPPLPGFVGKLFLFSSIIFSNSKILLFFIVLCTAVLSCFYYLRIIKIIYFNNSNGWGFFPIISYTCSIVISIIFLLLFHFFFFSEYINILSMYLAFVFIQ